MAEPGGNPAIGTDIHTLVADHHAALYAYAYRLSGNAAEAEDLTQQAFLVAHEKSKQIRDPSKARGWLYRVLRNTFLKGLRTAEPSRPGPVESELESLAQPIREDAIDRQKLAQALAALPESYRLVLVMFYFEELTYKEIASELDIKIGTVMSRLARAKVRLRADLEAAARDGSLGVAIPFDSVEETTSG